MTSGIEALVGFGRALREAGLPIDTSRSVQFCRAAALVDERELFWAGLSTLVSRPEDLPVYERVFDFYFGLGEGPRRPISMPRITLVQAEGTPGVGGEGEEPGAAGSHHPSRLELLRDSAFDPLDEAEKRAHANLVRRAVRMEPTRPVRRFGRGRRGEIDLRRTARQARACGGEPLRLVFRRQRHRLHRVVAVIDVSGSMAEHSRAMLILCHALIRARVPCSVFALGTRLTEITGCLDRRDPGEALEAVAETVPDLEGGTRLGDGLHVLLGRRSGVELVRGSTIVINSDGLETGSFGRLEAEMARLARLARHVIWVNPHLGEEGYEPTAGGMAAALPSLDAFLPGGGLDSLERLLALLEGGVPQRTPLRRAGSGPGS